MSVLLDTSVLVDVLRGHAPAVRYVTSLDDVPTCSEITRIEILRGVRSNERSSTEALLRTLRWIAVDEPIARRAGEMGRRYRRSHAGIGIADLIVAATAEELDIELKTLNVRHFPMFGGLKSPYNL